jgi:hypothetical protein
LQSFLAPPQAWKNKTNLQSISGLVIYIKFWSNSRRVWTTSELLSYRVPVAFLDNLEQIETLFPPLDDFDPGEPVASLD